MKYNWMLIINNEITCAAGGDCEGSFIRRLWGGDPVFCWWSDPFCYLSWNHRLLPENTQMWEQYSFIHLVALYNALYNCNVLTVNVHISLYTALYTLMCLICNFLLLWQPTWPMMVIKNLKGRRMGWAVKIRERFDSNSKYKNINCN